MTERGRRVASEYEVWEGLDRLCWLWREEGARNWGCRRQRSIFCPGTSWEEFSPSSILIFTQKDTCWISNLQNCKIINLWGIFWSHDVCGNLLHQQETDASCYYWEQGFAGEGSERKHQRTLKLLNWEFLQEYIICMLTTNTYFWWYFTNRLFNNSFSKEFAEFVEILSFYKERKFTT